MRDYKTGTWEGGDPACRHSAPGRFQQCACGALRRDQQLGLEPTLDAYLAGLVAVFEEVRRVLHPSGVAFVDMGDSYASAWPAPQNRRNLIGQPMSGGKRSELRKDRLCGLKEKDRMLVPFRLALLLQAVGWWVRDVIVWHKPAPMPESVTDRCTQSWEPIFMLTKAARYFFDAEAIKEPQTGNAHSRGKGITPRTQEDGSLMKANNSFHAGTSLWHESPDACRNPRNVWTIGPEPFTDSVTGTDGKPISHFATFPSRLVRLCVLAGTSARGCCPACGEPWQRKVEKEMPQLRTIVSNGPHGEHGLLGNARFDEPIKTRTTGWEPGCSCSAGEPVPATVLDVFAGTGTTLAVALELGRNAIGIELSPDYCELARRRCAKVTPGFPSLA